MKNQAMILFLVLGLGVTAGAFEKLPNQPLIPKDNPMTPAKISLGKQLYFDKRLSKDGTISCNSCHDAEKGGVDHAPTSTGIRGQMGKRNSPTVWNAAFFSVQFWDGRANTLEDQAKGPLINPIEMGNENHSEVVERIKKIEGYRKAFAKVFGGKNPVTIDNLAKAIASYERTLITSNSPFDQFMSGKKDALSAKAQAGMKLFQTVGCVSCHAGAHFSGPTFPVGQGFYMRFPLIPGNSYEKKYRLTEDQGRGEVTHQESDKNLWRVPSLRNVALTAPYFHNGSVDTLDEAVRVMAKSQLNKDLDASQVDELVEFLKSLSGNVGKQEAPVLLQ